MDLRWILTPCAPSTNSRFALSLDSMVLCKFQAVSDFQGSIRRALSLSLVTSLPPKLGDQFYADVLLLFIPQATPHFWLPALVHHCFPNLIHLSSSPLNTPAMGLSLASHDIAVFPISVHGSPALYWADEVWSHNSCQLTVLFLSVSLTFSPSWSPARSVIWAALEFYGFHSPRCDLLNFDQFPLGNIIMIVVPMMIVHTVFHMLLIHVSSHEWGRIIITQEELTKLPGTRISTECNSNLTGEAEPHAPSCSPSSCTHRLPSSSFLPNSQTDFPEINYEDISVGCFCFTPGHSSQ